MSHMCLNCNLHDLKEKGRKLYSIPFAIWQTDIFCIGWKKVFIYIIQCNSSLCGTGILFKKQIVAVLSNPCMLLLAPQHVYVIIFIG